MGRSGVLEKLGDAGERESVDSAWVCTWERKRGERARQGWKRGIESAALGTSKGSARLVPNRAEEWCRVARAWCRVCGHVSAGESVMFRRE